MTRVLLVEDHRAFSEGLGVSPEEAGSDHELGDFASLAVYEQLNL